MTQVTASVNFGLKDQSPVQYRKIIFSANALEFNVYTSKLILHYSIIF